jgi:hypothetical protein
LSVVIAYLRLYADCLRKTFRGIAKSPWALLLPVVLIWVYNTLGLLLGQIPLLGGFLIVFAMAAMGSSYLYFLGEIVSDARVSLRELRVSVGKYFWSIMNLLFVLWIADLLLSPVFRSKPNGPLFNLIYVLALLILLNPVPEVICQRGTYGGLASVQSSLAFIQENWIEWFIPNLPFMALGVIYWVPSLAIHLGIFPSLGPIPLLGEVILGACLHAAMVFRGHLFEALVGTSHRQRMYKYRAAA